VRFSLRLFGYDVLDLELTRDTDSSDEDDESTRPPFGFAGSGPGIISTADDTMLDYVETT